MQIIGIIVVILAVWAILAYNSFIRLRVRVDEAWADIDVQLKRRYDLIPNLIETVKGYAKHERETLDAVVKARSDAMSVSSEDVSAHGKAENMLAGTLKSLFALSENYPDLKANENFVELQRELSDTENKIQASRRFYNTNVRDLNIKTDTFPSNIVARVFGFTKRDFFDLDDAPAERENVKVAF